MKLKKLKQQVIVITGASSGIGLVTARAAAKAGARLVLAARSENVLRQLTKEISDAGGRAAYVVADVGREEDVERIASEAVNHFGGFDTWVNNAGVSIYGRMTDISSADHRQLFETNFWGVVYGSLTAVEHLRRRREAGAIINIGSTLSDRAVPVQGMYSASKHAVKGFTNALRMEIEKDELPISLTLVKPAAIDTPYSRHAKNYLDQEPGLPPPVYAPEVVAEAILHAAENPVRDIFAGGGGKALSAAENYAPRLTDKVMGWTMFRQQKSGLPVQRPREGGLYKANEDLQERGGVAGYVSESSLYTKASLRPGLTTLIVLGAGLGAAAVWRAARKGGNAEHIPDAPAKEPDGDEGHYPPVVLSAKAAGADQTRVPR